MPFVPQELVKKIKRPDFSLERMGLHGIQLAKYRPTWPTQVDRRKHAEIGISREAIHLEPLGMKATGVTVMKHRHAGYKLLESSWDTYSELGTTVF